MQRYIQFSCSCSNDAAAAIIVVPLLLPGTNPIQQYYLRIEEELDIGNVRVSLKEYFKPDAFSQHCGEFKTKVYTVCRKVTNQLKGF